MTDSERLYKIRSCIRLAEEWSEKQIMEQSLICMGALKDIRRHAFGDMTDEEKRRWR